MGHRVCHSMPRTSAADAPILVGGSFYKRFSPIRNLLYRIPPIITQQVRRQIQGDKE